MTDLYIIFLVIGIVLFITEVIVPGGIIGTIGFICLLIAGVVGFAAFGTKGGVLSLLAILVVSTVSMIVWLRIFPRTFIGKALSLEKSGDQFKANTEHNEFLGLEGVALTDLRPSGMISLEEKRVDVIAESGWISSGEKVKIIKIEGPRIIVRKTN